MSDIVAVLVVPAAGDPGGLLAVRDPWYTFPPPTVTWSEVRGWRIGRDVTNPMRVVMPHWALPLWWDGALVPEGWDRARRIIDSAPLPGAAMDFVHDFHPDVVMTEAIADWLVQASLAARVVRLARVDGRLVEVES